MNRAHFLVRLAPVVLLFFAAGCFRPAGESIEPTTGAVLPLTLPAEQATDPSSAAAETDEADIVPTAETLEAEVFPTLANTQAQTEIQPTSAAPTTAVTVFPTLVAATLTPRFITPGSPLGPVTPDTATPTSNLPPTSTPSGLITPTSLPGTEDGDCTYIVQSGDSLYHIATTRGLTVEDMMSANPDLVGDPPILQPGQALQLPDCDSEDTAVESSPATAAPATTAPSVPAGGEMYTVQPGDTLYNIAQRNGLTVQELIDANNLPDPDRLDVGQQIIIPSGS